MEATSTIHEMSDRIEEDLPADQCQWGKNSLEVPSERIAVHPERANTSPFSGHRTHHRNSSPGSRITSMNPRGVVAWATFLCALHLQQFSPPLVAIRCRKNGHPLLVEAFSNGWLPSRRPLSPLQGLVAEGNASPSLLARLGHIAPHSSCRRTQATGVPRRVLKWSEILQASQQSHSRVLLICESTISNEAVETELKKDAAIQVSMNGASDANGDNGSISVGISGANCVDVNGDDVNGHRKSNNFTSVDEISQKIDGNSSLEVPMPTSNGGYTHTSASRAKISAANKGRKPWNKGRACSDEVRARIAEGVRRHNREKFLAKLEEEGITEEEYNRRKKEKRRKKDAERRARKTANGGYTPTEETKKKISKILKEKYASGEVTRRPRDPSKVRRGFRHTEETRRKISESLRRKWAEDAAYRELMTNKTVASGNVEASVRKRISESLKRRWAEPEFRASMMAKLATRKTRPGTRDEAHRRKISASMKRKWMDEEYRKRATEGMAKGAERRVSEGTVTPVRPRMPVTRPNYGSDRREVLGVSAPAKAVAASKRKPKSPARRRAGTATGRKTVRRGKNPGIIKAVKPLTAPVARTAPANTSTNRRSAPRRTGHRKEELAEDGSISRLREERRDLYDLLYGDDDSGGGGDGAARIVGGGTVTGQPRGGTPRGRGTSAAPPSIAATGLLEDDDDDDLDDFDPYGLQDAVSTAFGRA